MESSEHLENRSKDLAKRLLRTVVNTMMLFLLAQVFFLLAPQGGLFRVFGPIEGYNTLTAVLLLLLMVLLFLGVRIMADVIRIANYLSLQLTSLFPGLKRSKGVSLARALKELTYTLILMFATTMVIPPLSTIPHVGQYLSVAVMAVSLTVAIVLCYDAGKTFYSAMETGIEILIDRLFRSHSHAKKPNDSGTTT